MEIEVETDEFVKKEKSIAKLFSPKKNKVPKKEIKKTKIETAPKVKVVGEVARKRNWAVLVFVPTLILLSLTFGLASYFYYTKYEKALKTPVLSERDKDQSIVDSISRSMELPNGESPIVAAVTDVEKLREKSLFPDAQTDDQAVIYLEANKTIIYRPSSGKIVDVIAFLEKEKAVEENEGGSSTSQVVVANIETEEKVEQVLAETSEQTQQQEKEKKIRVAVYNGTKIKGLSEKLAKDISSANADTEVVIKADANGEYAKTIVIDLVGNNTDFASSLAGVLGADVSTSFPDGEPMPEAEVLVIGGGK